MKKLLLLAATLTIFGACKNDKDPNTTTVTTEETTTVDTIGPKVRTETVIEETTKTDTTEHTVSTGGVKVEPVQDEPKKQ